MLPQFSCLMLIGNHCQTSSSEAECPSSQASLLSGRDQGCLGDVRPGGASLKSEDRLRFEETTGGYRKSWRHSLFNSEQLQLNSQSKKEQLQTKEYLFQKSLQEEVFPGIWYKNKIYKFFCFSSHCSTSAFTSAGRWLGHPQPMNHGWVAMTSLAEK